MSITAYSTKEALLYAIVHGKPVVLLSAAAVPRCSRHSTDLLENNPELELVRDPGKLPPEGSSHDPEFVSRTRKLFRENGIEFVALHVRSYWPRPDGLVQAELPPNLRRVAEAALEQTGMRRVYQGPDVWLFRMPATR